MYWLLLLGGMQGEEGGGSGIGEMSNQSMGEVGKDFFSYLFLEILTEGAETTEAYSLT